MGGVAEAEEAVEEAEGAERVMEAEAVGADAGTDAGADAGTDAAADAAADAVAGTRVAPVEVTPEVPLAAFLEVAPMECVPI